MTEFLPIRDGIAVPMSEIAVRASRSSGPGGQHANVTASRIEASLDIAATTALSETQKQRAMAKLGPRVTAVAQDARSQARNRELALQRLASRLAHALEVPRVRTKTRPTAASRRRRLDEKRRRGDTKRGRGRPFDDAS
ncbi:alternative ribosome rescue aminoacyl-tRNA hydrolase ArfB [Candidatus Solirubrobacter pratensis]|uniref:alternative ribosome rescue aminoacyl-tRNA hydrolase ArfB n=1 Tax=Candidatus Solirubrobacter pratensis TaxID=1298857 RepID=UPI00041178ED|nr:alternative ribosome rescue aminoacyl-tRNA hydrolase ArfB [Candidatus Solirubrobacter pratensis]